MLPEIIASLPSNVLSGLAGAFALWALNTSLQKCRELVLNKKYTLGGEYLTKYEDLAPSGKTIWRKASAQLIQKGTLITGKTKNLDDGRTWILNLRITKQKNLTGNYISEDPHDSSLGTVVLEIISPLRLEGVWAGYDSVNKSIQSGRYVFLKVLSPSIVMLSDEHVNPVLALFGACLGEKYITPEQLGAYALPDVYDKSGFVALVEEKIAGAIICQTFSIDATRDAVPTPIDILTIAVPEIRFCQKIGLLRSIAVSERFRGRGIATALIGAATRWLASQGAVLVLAAAWAPSGDCHARGVLESCGYREAGTIDEFWYTDSLEKGYACPACGNPCRCPAVIFACYSK